ESIGGFSLSHYRTAHRVGAAEYIPKDPKHRILPAAENSVCRSAFWPGSRQPAVHHASEADRRRHSPCVSIGQRLSVGPLSSKSQRGFTGRQISTRYLRSGSVSGLFR